MASRLSERVGSVSGGAGPFRLPKVQPLVSHLGIPSAQEILTSEHPASTIAAMHPQDVFHCLAQADLEERQQLLPYVTAEQFHRILDYDAWSALELRPEKVLLWLHLAAGGRSERLVQRFRDLEPEYPIALFQPLVRVLTSEELDGGKLPDGAVPYPFPGGDLHYTILAKEPAMQESLHLLIEGMIADDIEGTYLLLSQAEYSLPHEEETLLAQFRRARLEEDGFVPPEIAVSALSPVDPSVIRARYRLSSLPHFAPGIVRTGAKLWVEALAADSSREDLDNLRRVLCTAANWLAAAVGVDPGDVSARQTLLRYAASYVSLGLETLVGLDAQLALNALGRVPPVEILRVAFHSVAELRDSIPLQESPPQDDSDLARERLHQRLPTLVREGNEVPIASHDDLAAVRTQCGLGALGGRSVVIQPMGNTHGISVHDA